MAIAIEQAARQAGDTSGKRRQLVVNLDGGWEFTRLARRWAPDLFREREFAAEGRRMLDLWDAGRSADADTMAREADRMWRWWPRPLGGDVTEAIAEVEERLQEDLDARDHVRSTLFVIAGSATDRACEFLAGLGHYFAADERRNQRREVDVVLIVGGLAGPHQSYDLGSELSRYDFATLPVDAIVALDPRRRDVDAAADSWQTTTFAFLRLMLEALREEVVATSVMTSAKPAPGRKMPKVLRLDVRSQRLNLTGEAYAQTVRDAVQAVHRVSTTKEDEATSPSKVDFLEHLRGLIGQAGSDGEAGNIVSDVVNAFMVSEVIPADERELVLVGQRFRGLTGVTGRRWRRSDTLLASLDQAMAGFLMVIQLRVAAKLGEPVPDEPSTDVERALWPLVGRRGLAAAPAQRASTLTQSEEVGVKRRNVVINDLRMLNIAWFGSGNRAANNQEQAERLVDSALAATQRRISAFWADFRRDDREARTLSGIQLLRTYCPLANPAWVEFSGTMPNGSRGLLHEYEAMQKALDALPAAPSWWALITVSSALFFGMPVAWLLVRFFSPADLAIPVSAWLVWIMLFLASLALPQLQMARARRRVEAALDRLDETCRGVIAAMNARMKSVAEYAGEIQRHHYLKRLQRRVRELVSEADMANRYVSLLDRSLGWTTSDEPRGTPHEGLINYVRTAGNAANWLEFGLRNVELKPPRTTLAVEVLGGASLDVSTAAFEPGAGNGRIPVALAEIDVQGRDPGEQPTAIAKPHYERPAGETPTEIVRPPDGGPGEGTR